MTGILGLVIGLLTVLVQYAAQADYFSTASEHPSLSDVASSRLSLAVTTAGLFSEVAVILLVVCAAAGAMWALARLAIAYKGTK